MRCVSMLVACVTVLSAMPVPAQNPDQIDIERWAVLIGINDYANPKVHDLKYCLADQRDLRTELIRSNFDARQVILLEDDAKEKQLLPFKNNIEKQIELVCKLAKRGDLVLISFSGHGLNIGKTSYWCPADAKLDDPASLISVDWVYEKMQKCRADLRLVMVDACRNVPPEEDVTRSFKEADLEEHSRAFVSLAERLPEGLLLLNSCSEGEKSAEDEKFGHGVFMHFVLEGLRGQADKDKNGRVTFGELTSFASRETKLHVAHRFADSQRPKLKGNLTGDVLDFEMASLSRTANRPNTPTPPLRTDDLNKTITNTVSMKLALIPAGEFEMGSHEDALALLKRFPYATPDDIEGEWPVHRVRITEPFYLGAHEVTLRQFLKFYHDANYKCECERDGKGGWGWTGSEFEQRKSFVAWSWGFSEQTMDHPVVNVTWNDAVAFCAWLSKKENATYRLPTEAEWEYACRAGTKSRFWFGDDVEDLVRYANVADQSHKKIWGAVAPVIAKYENGKLVGGKIPFPFLTGSDGYGFTAPVGSFKANAWGLHDMHGNVWEWCADRYDAKYYGVSPPDDPQGPQEGSHRVYRGGSWYGTPQCGRSADRVSVLPSLRFNRLGFRVARQVRSDR